MLESQVQNRSGGGFSPGEQSRRRGVEDSYSQAQALFEEVNALANRLRKSGTGVDRNKHLPAGGLMVVQVLDQHGPQTVPGIARHRGTSRQNIQRLVNRLKAEGCVELTDNPAHKRSALVQCTSRGKDLLSLLNERETKQLETLLPHLSEAGVASATALLRQIRHWLAGTEGPPAEVLRKPVMHQRAEVLPHARRRRKRAAADATFGPREQQPPTSKADTQAEDEFPVSLL